MRSRACRFRQLMHVPSRPVGRAQLLWEAPSLFPVALTLAWAIQIYGETGAPVEDLWRPLAVVVGPVITVVGLLQLASRRPELPILGFAITWLLLLKAWVLLVPLIVAAIWRLLVIPRRSALAGSDVGRPIGQVTRLLNTFSLLLLVLTLAQVAVTFSAALPQNQQRGIAAPGAPNIYMLLLDGYPRSDTLERLRIDNFGFEDDLRERGLNVSAASRSSYTNTVLSLASLFSGDYLPRGNGSPPPFAGRDQWELRRISQRITSGAMLAALRSFGYFVVTAPSAYGPATLWNADIVLGRTGISRAELSFIQASYLPVILDQYAPDWLLNQYWSSNASVWRGMDSFQPTAEQTPLFFFGHVLSPHPPFLYEASGGAADTSPCRQRGCGSGPQLDDMGLTLEEYAALLRGQILYLNQQVLDAIDALIAKDPGAVIIVFSDHGARFRLRDNG